VYLRDILVFAVAFYSRIFTNLGRFILAFIKTVLICCTNRLLIVFTIKFWVNQVKPLRFIARNEWPRFTRPQSSELWRLWAMLESYQSIEETRSRVFFQQRSFIRLHVVVKFPSRYLLI